MSTQSFSAGARGYLASWLVRAGLIILGIGCGPLLLIIIASALGLTRDPDPNPVGPGMLAIATFWPGMILLGIGVAQHRLESERARDRRHPLEKVASSAVAGAPNWDISRMLAAGAGLLVSSFAGRTLAAIGGILLCLEGVAELPDGGGRGAASMIVLGIVLLSCGVFGRIPQWAFRRPRR